MFRLSACDCKFQDQNLLNEERKNCAMFLSVVAVAVAVSLSIQSTALRFCQSVSRWQSVRSLSSTGAAGILSPGREKRTYKREYTSRCAVPVVVD